MLGSNFILSWLTMGIAVLGLLVVFEKHLVAAIRAGKAVLAEVGF
jgi:hypothetical protein